MPHESWCTSGLENSLLVCLFSLQMDRVSIFHKLIGNNSLLGLTIKKKSGKKKREWKKRKSKKNESNFTCDLLTGLTLWVNFNTSLICWDTEYFHFVKRPKGRNEKVIQIEEISLSFWDCYLLTSHLVRAEESLGWIAAVLKAERWLCRQAGERKWREWERELSRFMSVKLWCIRGNTCEVRKNSHDAGYNFGVWGGILGELCCSVPGWVVSLIFWGRLELQAMGFGQPTLLLLQMPEGLTCPAHVAGAPCGTEPSVGATTEDLSGRTDRQLSTAACTPSSICGPRKRGEGIMYFGWRGRGLFLYVILFPFSHFFFPSLQWCCFYLVNPCFVTELPDVLVQSSLGLVHVMEWGFSDVNPCLGCWWVNPGQKMKYRT